MRSGTRMRDSCRWQRIEAILRFHGGFTCVFFTAPPTPRADRMTASATCWRCPVLGPAILAASRSDKMRRIVSAAPVTKPVVNRFIPGETVDQVIPIVVDLTEKGLE